MCPIQLSLPQSTGVIATYHKVIGYAGGDTSLVPVVASYLNNTAGLSPIITQSIDIGSVLDAPSSTPPAGTTIRQVVYSILENALIAQQTPAPLPPPNADGTPGTLLPPVNGVFYGGVIVA